MEEMAAGPAAEMVWSVYRQDSILCRFLAASFECGLYFSGPSAARIVLSKRRWIPLLMLIGLAIFPGCVRRRLFVNTNPPGALVYVDNQQIGTTPCAVDFTYYGTREIRLVKPGFETLSVNQPIPTPWYQFPPLDFVSENLVPYKIRDNRSVTYNLAPQVLVPKEELIARGEQLRQETGQGTVLPAAAVGVGR